MEHFRGGRRSAVTNIFDDIADGDVIAVPNDTTNEARALLLLQDNGLLTLKDDAEIGRAHV